VNDAVSDMPVGVVRPYFFCNALIGKLSKDDITHPC
jgi:hypothetical protein